MRGRSQITFPFEIVKKLGIGEGDKFEVMERDGGVFLCPVVVYPKAKMEETANIAVNATEVITFTTIVPATAAAPYVIGAKTL
jgi:bifunctional DNA-binding transcriptional regulator/antitoxin component of YhaV-PrlF toxin-antitoxin module